MLLRCVSAQAQLEFHTRQLPAARSPPAECYDVYGHYAKTRSAVITRESPLLRRARAMQAAVSSSETMFVGADTACAHVGTWMLAELR